MIDRRWLGALALAGAAGRTPSRFRPARRRASACRAERLKNIETFFAGEIERNRVPGAVVAIARQGKLVYFKAFGFADKARGMPTTTDTIFQLASMTKPMVAVGAPGADRAGAPAAAGQARRLLPGVRDDAGRRAGADGKFTLEPQKRPILIHDLFRHTSGLTYGGRPDAGSPIAAQWPSGGAASYMGKSDEMAEALTKLPLVYQPGTVFEYGLSFDVLGAVVEKITGKTLGGHLADTVWKPLKMTDTTFRLDRRRSARASRGRCRSTRSTASRRASRRSTGRRPSTAAAPARSARWATTSASARCC